jgi:hypothetical protein
MVENPAYFNEIYFTQNSLVNYPVSFGTHFQNKIIIFQKAFMIHIHGLHHYKGKILLRVSVTKDGARIGNWIY